ncbi:uncharacterized protein LOC136026875 isoform X2 [Artemia franciscana]|uniref:uncharacterized protein LOC136026875 isoform X2 n=1 Tax=Artemia franciscana TaxID=6661 RepID=UPI0032DA44E0
MSVVFLPLLFSLMSCEEIRFSNPIVVRPFNGKLMPKYDGSPNGNHEKDAQNIRENIRQSRLDDIKNQMMGVFGPNRTIPVFNFSQLKWEMNVPQKAQKMIQILPSCLSPRNADETMWSLPIFFNVFFDLQNLSNILSNPGEILNAKLVLHKDPELQTDATHDFDMDSYETGQRIKVSLYAYSRPLKKSRSRKKLVSSRWFYPNEQIELIFDITKVTRQWMWGSTRTTNHGLFLEAVNEDGQTTMVSSLFPRPCGHPSAKQTHNVSLNITVQDNSEKARESAGNFHLPLLQLSEKLNNDPLANVALDQLREIHRKFYPTPKPLKTPDPQFITLSVLEEIDYLGPKTEPTKNIMNDVQSDGPAETSVLYFLTRLFRSG